MENALDNIRIDIRSLLYSIGYKDSPHSGRVVFKEYEISNPDSSPDAPKTIKVIRQYKLGKKKLVKITDGHINYSIPYSQLEIVNGHIRKIEKETKNI